MVDYPYEANFLAPLPAYPVKASCQIILNAQNTLRGLAQAAGEYRFETILILLATTARY